MLALGKMKKISLGGMVAGALIVASSFSVTGCLTDDKKTDSTATGTHTAFPAATTIAAGAQGAALGSVLDLDTKTALTSAQANAAQSSIDLVFMFYAGAFHMDNPKAARLAGIANSINLTNTYTEASLKDTKIVKVSAAPADQEAAKVAFDGGTASPSNVIVGGEFFLVETTSGKISLVKVGAIVGTDKLANANFDVSISTI
ncbi:MAG: hypothetical protein JWO30_3494 [Fibrobacteres bacterium]|nr:hypothetical protein [Fibrobacterota bacterium]